MLKHIRLYIWLAIACAALALSFAAPHATAQTGRSWQPGTGNAALQTTDSVTLTLQYGLNGYAGSSDTYISEYDRNATHPADPLHLRAVNLMAPLLRFDLSGQLPEGAQLQQATLELHTAFAGANPIEAQTFRVLRPWEVAQATWNQAADGAPWNTAGCDGLDADREAVNSDQQTLAEQHAWYRFDVTAMAQSWLNDPSGNYGLIVKSFGPSASEFSLASNEYPDALAHPRLVIVYVIPATPTPTRLPTRIPTDTATPTPTTPPPTPTATHTPPANRVIVTFQNKEGGYAGAEDTFLDVYLHDQNHGGEGELSLRAPDVRDPLLRFDLSAIPSDALVYSATLELFATYNGGHPLDVGIYAVTRPWVENQATWDLAAENTPWGQPGCNQPDLDRAANPEFIVVVHEAHRWYRLSVANMVQSWVGKSQANDGMILKSWTDIQIEHKFASSEYQASAELYPRLIVSYYLNRPLLVTSLPLILRNRP